MVCSKVVENDDGATWKSGAEHVVNEVDEAGLVHRALECSVANNVVVLDRAPTTVRFLSQFPSGFRVDDSDTERRSPVRRGRGDVATQLVEKYEVTRIYDATSWRNASRFSWTSLSLGDAKDLFPREARSLERTSRARDGELHAMPGGPLLAEFGNRSVGFFREELRQQRKLFVQNTEAGIHLYSRRAPGFLVLDLASVGAIPKLRNVEELRDFAVRHVALGVSGDDPSSKVHR